MDWANIKSPKKMVIAAFGVALGLVLILGFAGLLAWAVGFFGLSIPFFG